MFQYDYTTSLTLALRHPAIRPALRQLLIMTAGFIAVFLLVWWPIDYRLHNMKERINQARMTLVAQLQSDKIKQSHRLANKTLAKFNAGKGPALKQASLVAELAALAKRHQLTINRQSFEKSVNENGITTIQQRIQISGSYRHLKKFLYDLQTLSTWTMVKEAKIEKTGYKSSAVTATLLLATYRSSKD